MDAATTEIYTLSLLPALPISAQVTGVAPTGKVEPLVGLHTTITLGQLSRALTAYVTLLALHCPGSAAISKSAGQLGGWLSTTITVCVQLLELPCTSVAVQTTA